MTDYLVDVALDGLSNCCGGQLKDKIVYNAYTYDMGAMVSWD